MPSTSKITIKDVAAKAGVSIASVSRFLNNPAILKEKNRKKIEQIVKELNYHPLIYARRLAGGKLGVFSLIIPGYEGIFYSFFAIEIIRGIANALDLLGTDLHLHIFRNKDNFKTSLVDGVIFCDILGNESQIERVKQEGLPLVVINKKIELPDISYVAVNNFKGAYEAVEFLIRHGHKKIAHLAGDLRIQCAEERLEGYKKALEKNGISLREDYVMPTNFSRKEAHERLEKLFSHGDFPTAIFCCSDEVAVEVLSFADEKKISIPNNLSVIGFDDNPNCFHGNLMLTTIRQPIGAMTKKAVEILNEALDDSHVAPVKAIFDTELVIRDTVHFI